MASLTTIRQRLAALINSNVSGITAYPAWPGQYHVPCAIVMSAGNEANMTFGSTATYNLTRYDFELIVLVPLAAGNEEAQKKLDDFTSGTGSKSLWQAISTDRTLGGNASSTFCGTWSAYEEEPLNETIYLTQRLPLTVWAV